MFQCGRRLASNKQPSLTERKKESAGPDWGACVSVCARVHFPKGAAMAEAQPLIHVPPSTAQRCWLAGSRCGVNLLFARACFSYVGTEVIVK